VRLELRLERFARLGGPRDDHDSAGPLIEPVDNPGARVRGRVGRPE
jgi:hypothetical protein